LRQRQIHNLEVGELWSLLRSRAEGLRPDEVAQRLADIGPNALAPPPRWVWFRVLVKQFTNPFSMLLDVSAALCFVAEHMRPGEGMAFLGWALVAAAVLNALFTFAQAIRAERAMQALRSMLPQRITVRRGGVEGEVRSKSRPGRRSCCRKVTASGRRAAGRQQRPAREQRPLTASRGTRADASASRRVAWSTRRTSYSPAARRCAARARRWSTPPGDIRSSARSPRSAPRCAGCPDAARARSVRTVRILTLVAVLMGAAFFGYGLAVGRPSG
jgi:sodium/potassium-transporting ATPase subunit alpha